MSAMMSNQRGDSVMGYTSPNEWLAKRQESYEIIMAWLGVVGPPDGDEIWDAHKKAVELLDALPISEGGRL